MTPRPKRWQSKPSKPQQMPGKGGFRSLPIAEYEAIYGSVGEFQRVDGGIVEFVLEGNHARFIRVMKDGKQFNILRWPKEQGT
jgi:hypothetical protein